MFEPTHGSVPKYAGQYKVNPIAMLLTVKLMFDWLNEDEMATRLESDMGGNVSTLDTAKAVANYATA